MHSPHANQSHGQCLLCSFVLETLVYGTTTTITKRIWGFMLVLRNHWSKLLITLPYLWGKRYLQTYETNLQTYVKSHTKAFPSLYLWSKEPNFKMQPLSFMWYLTLETKPPVYSFATSLLFWQVVVHFCFTRWQRSHTDSEPQLCASNWVPQTLSAPACCFFRRSSSQANKWMF